MGEIKIREQKAGNVGTWNTATLPRVRVRRSVKVQPQPSTYMIESYERRANDLELIGKVWHLSAARFLNPFDPVWKEDRSPKSESGSALSQQVANFIGLPAAAGLIYSAYKFGASYGAQRLTNDVLTIGIASVVAVTLATKLGMRGIPKEVIKDLNSYSPSTKGVVQTLNTYPFLLCDRILRTHDVLSALLDGAAALSRVYSPTSAREVDTKEMLRRIIKDDSLTTVEQAEKILKCASAARDKVTHLRTFNGRNETPHEESNVVKMLGSWLKRNND